MIESLGEISTEQSCVGDECRVGVYSRKRKGAGRGRSLLDEETGFRK